MEYKITGKIKLESTFSLDPSISRGENDDGRIFMELQYSTALPGSIYLQMGSIFLRFWEAAPTPRVNESEGNVTINFPMKYFAPLYLQLQNALQGATNQVRLVTELGNFNVWYPRFEITPL